MVVSESMPVGGIVESLHEMENFCNAHMPW